MKAYKLSSQTTNTTRYATDLDEIVSITNSNRQFAGKRIHQLKVNPQSWVILKKWLVSIVDIDDESSIFKEKTND